MNDTTRIIMALFAIGLVGLFGAEIVDRHQIVNVVMALWLTGFPFIAIIDYGNRK